MQTSPVFKRGHDTQMRQSSDSNWPLRAANGNTFSDKYVASPFRAALLIGTIIDGKRVTHIGGFGPESERLDFGTSNTAKWLTFDEIDQLIADNKESGA